MHGFSKFVYDCNMLARIKIVVAAGVVASDQNAM